MFTIRVSKRKYGSRWTRLWVKWAQNHAKILPFSVFEIVVRIQKGFCHIVPYSYVVSRHFAYVRHHFWWASEISLGKKQGFVLWRTLCIDAKLGKIRVLSLLKFQDMSCFFIMYFFEQFFYIIISVHNVNSIWRQ